MSAKKLFGLVLVAAVVAMGLKEISAITPTDDKQAGWMADVLSSTGTELDILWYTRFMAELDALEARLDSITASVQHAQTQTPNAVAYITDAVANTTAKLPDLQALHDSLNITDDTMVAFSTGDGSITYDYGSTNPIDLTPATPDYNTGAYDEASSTFVAPRDGLYLFILRTTVGYSVNVEMLLNGVEVITAANSGGYYDIKMRVAIRFLSAGDYVALYSGGTGSGTVYQSNGLFFSGLLLTGNKKLMPDFRNV